VPHNIPFHSGLCLPCRFHRRKSRGAKAKNALPGVCEFCRQISHA